MLAQAQGDFSTQASELAAAVATTDNAGRKTGAAYERAFVFFSLGFFDVARTEWSKVWEGTGNWSLHPERMAPYEGYFALRRGDLPRVHGGKRRPAAADGEQFVVAGTRAP